MGCRLGRVKLVEENINQANKKNGTNRKDI